jgi:ribosome-binding protein aMBF1 (putative translation factor)
MPRDESVSDEYVAELQAKFLVEAERVKAARDWAETQKQMVAGTYPYLIAQSRVNEGWTQEEIARELAVRIVTGRLVGPINVIGDEKRDEI